MEATYNVDQPHWRDTAACRGLDTDIFFPDPDDEAAVRAATDVCDSCPVRFDCLLFAQGQDNSVGVWGGELFELKPESEQ